MKKAKINYTNYWGSHKENAESVIDDIMNNITEEHNLQIIRTALKKYWNLPMEETK